MRMLFRLTVLSLAAFGAKTFYDRFVNPQIKSRAPSPPMSSDSVQSFGSTRAVYLRRCIAVRSCSAALLLGLLLAQ